MRCPNCKEEVPEGSNFCMFCAKDLKSENESVKVEFSPTIDLSPIINLSKSAKNDKKDVLDSEFKFSKLHKLILNMEPAVWKDFLFFRILRQRAVFIIVGAWEGAELFDRLAAYKIVEELEKRDLQALVLTDKYWWEAVEKFGYNNPTISVGGPISNSLSDKIAKEFELGGTGIGVKEIDGRITGFVWGADARKNLEAVVTFIKFYLDEFVEVAKDRLW